MKVSLLPLVLVLLVGGALVVLLVLVRLVQRMEASLVLLAAIAHLVPLVLSSVPLERTLRTLVVVMCLTALRVHQGVFVDPSVCWLPQVRATVVSTVTLGELHHLHLSGGHVPQATVVLQVLRSRLLAPRVLISQKVVGLTAHCVLLRISALPAP